MRWIFDNVPLVVILFVIVSIVRGVAKFIKPGNPAETPRAGGNEENDEQRRVREIQERIRKIAAERRGERPASPMRLPAPAAPPPLARAEPVNSPPQRKLEEIERRLRSASQASQQRHTAEVERQQRLREELEDLEEKKFLAARQAQHRADAQQAEEQSESGQRATARAQLLADLRAPQSLRRAIVLREVLGAPVGLR